MMTLSDFHCMTRINRNTWMHSDDFTRRSSKAESILLWSGHRNSIKICGENSESVLQPTISDFVTTLETSRTVLFGREIWSGFVNLCRRRVMARPDEWGRQVNEVTGLAAAETLLCPWSSLVSGMVVANIEICDLQISMKSRMDFFPERRK